MALVISDFFFRSRKAKLNFLYPFRASSMTHNWVSKTCYVKCLSRKKNLELLKDPAITKEGLYKIVTLFFSHQTLEKVFHNISLEEV